jgi:DNA-binding transcriptional ArsR family regulator
VEQAPFAAFRPGDPSANARLRTFCARSPRRKRFADAHSLVGIPSCARQHERVTYNQMVVQNELTDDEVNRIFRALADATRRDIVRRTLVAEVSVSQLAESYDMSFAAVQKHVAALEEAGLITKDRRGRERMVRSNPERIRKAQRLLDQFEQLWRSRIDRLDAVLEEEAN